MMTDYERGADAMRETMADFDLQNPHLDWMQRAIAFAFMPIPPDQQPPVRCDVVREVD